MKFQNTILFISIFLLLFSTTLSAQVCIGNPTFDPHLYLASANMDNLTGIFSIDLDCDGDMDIIAGAADDNKLSWFENDGNQSFTEHIISTSVQGIRNVYAAKMHKKGAIDILATAFGGDKIYVFINDGMQNFSSSTLNGGDGAMDVIAADVNMDGLLDIVFTAFTEGVVGYYPNDAAGGFDAIKLIVDNNFEGTGTVEAVDFDKDGDLDVLSTSLYDKKVTVFLNNGTGTFSSDISVGSGENYTSAYTADFNKDGLLDVVASVPAEDVILLYQNNGLGGFTQQVVSGTAKGVIYVKPTDLDGDGDMDILAVLQGSDELAAYLNDGALNFTKIIIDEKQTGILIAFSIDLDRDGDIDVISGSPSNEQLNWFENTCTNCTVKEFPQRLIDNSFPRPKHASAFDMDGDGDMDVLVFSGVDSTIYWHENNGNQVYTKHNLSSSVSSIISDLTATDIDKDGDLDVVYISRQVNGKVVWLENDGNQVFSKHIIATPLSLSTLATIDLDQDGDMDIVVGTNQSGSALFWYENDGSESFTEHSISLVSGGINNIFIIDIEKDGDYDILAASSSPTDKFMWLENDGSQSFTEHLVEASRSIPIAILGADMDKDGDIDLISGSKSDKIIKWHENNGSQVFTAHTITQDATNLGELTVGDLDDDGDVDILYSATHSGDTTLAWYDNQNLSFIPHAIIINIPSSINNYCFSVDVADMDCDGDKDVLGSFFFGNKINWFENSCDFECAEPLLVLNYQPIPAGTYQGFNMLESAGIIESGSTVVFKGDPVTLKAGFYAKAGSDFLAEFSNCPLPSPLKNEDNQLVERAKKENEIIANKKTNLQIAPNPSRGETIISYQLREPGPVHLAVYSMQGEEMLTLQSNVIQDTGEYRQSFFASDLPRGIYIVGLRTKKGLVSQKMVVVR